MNQTLHKDVQSTNFSASVMVLLGSVPISKDLVKVAA